MPLARTNVGSFHTAGPVASTTFTTGSFTPANNSLLVVCAHMGDTSGATDTTTISGGGWSKQTENIDASNFHKATQWTAPVATGASMTVTVGTGAGATSEFDVHVFYYTGYDTSTPIGATASSPVAASNFSMSLSGAPATTSEVLAFMVQDTNAGAHAIAVGSGYTEQFNTDDTANLNSQSQTRTGSTSTTVVWANSGADGVALAIEVRQAAGGGDTLGGAMPTLMMSRRKDEKKIWVPGRRIIKPSRKLLRAA